MANTIYATTQRESQKKNPVAIFSRPLVFAIPTPVKNMNY